jgi:hypothetical protein
MAKHDSFRFSVGDSHRSQIARQNRQRMPLFQSNTRYFADCWFDASESADPLEKAGAQANVARFTVHCSSIVHYISIVRSSPLLAGLLALHNWAGGGGPTGQRSLNRAATRRRAFQHGTPEYSEAQSTAPTSRTHQQLPRCPFLPTTTNVNNHSRQTTPLRRPGKPTTPFIPSGLRRFLCSYGPRIVLPSDAQKRRPFGKNRRQLQLMVAIG